MCKNCVEALTTISEGMYKIMREGFEKAIMRDMSREMADEEGMFHLFIYEHVAETVKKAIDLTVMEEMIRQVGEAMFSGINTPLREVFENEWA